MFWVILRDFDNTFILQVGYIIQAVRKMLILLMKTYIYNVLWFDFFPLILVVPNKLLNFFFYYKTN